MLSALADVWVRPFRPCFTWVYARIRYTCIDHFSSFHRENGQSPSPSTGRLWKNNLVSCEIHVKSSPGRRVPQGLTYSMRKYAFSLSDLLGKPPYPPSTLLMFWYSQDGDFRRFFSLRGLKSLCTASIGSWIIHHSKFSFDAENIIVQAWEDADPARRAGLSMKNSYFDRWLRNFVTSTEKGEFAIWPNRWPLREGSLRSLWKKWKCNLRISQGFSL